jgi:signal transduction histidine kinase
MEDKDLRKQLDGIKDYVLNKVLVIVLFIQMIGLVVSISRMSQTGFKFIYGIHMALVVLVVAIFLLRNKMSTALKGGLFMVALYTLAISGLSSWGLYGFGYIYFIPATAIAFLYFDKRTGWILTLGSLAAIIGIGVLFAKGILGFYPGAENYMQSFAMWLNMVITLSLITIVITFFWNNLFGMLINTFHTINKQQQNLEQINSELLVAKEKAEQSDRLKSSFLANISHEIRTPLNIIIGFSQMVAETPDERERVEFHQTVRENCDIMLKLVNDIVDFSKIESNSLTLTCNTFNLADVIDDVQKRLKPMVAPEVELRIKPLEIQLNADKNRISQIVFNMLHNALKFTQSGAIELKCSVEGNQLHLQVMDTGIGIDRAHHELIFDRFYKVDTFVQGSGLGLSLSRSIARMMNGDIRVESELGKGSIFRFILPVDAA